MSSIPLISGQTTGDLKGTTNQLNGKGYQTSYRSFAVNRAQEYNFTIQNPQMQVQIFNSKNEVVTTINSDNAAADGHARLSPGEYYAVLTQKFKGVYDRDSKGAKVDKAYDLTISERSTETITAAGGTLKGQARPVEGTENGVQKHTLNVAQGGTFDIQTTIPGTRWSILKQDGTMVANGDNIEGDAATNYLTSSGTTIDPGTYDVVMVFPTSMKTQQPWNLSFTPKADIPQIAPKTSEIRQILADRDARLKRWAAEDAAKAAKQQKSG